MQQNCRVSKDIALTLINDIDPANVDLILIQEPYIYPNTNLSIASPKWCAIYPLGRPTCARPPHSLILVSTNIDLSVIQQIPLLSNCVTAITFTPVPGVDPVHLFNIYNPPNSDEALTDLSNWLEGAPDHRCSIWAGDFNKHHPMWSRHTVPERCSRSNTEMLIQLLLQNDMLLRLPQGMLTYQSDSHGTWSTLDLVFSTQDIAGLIPSCYAGLNEWLPGADHFPIYFTINTQVKRSPPTARLNFKDIDWSDYRSTLKTNITTRQLHAYPPPSSPQALDTFVDNLTTAIQLTTASIIPKA